MRFTKGDKVGILVNIPYPIKHRKKARGVITRIDGEYIYVRPLWCKWETELYDYELVYEWDPRY